MNKSAKYEFSWPFFGNRHIIDFLQSSINNGELSHFYIFSGARDLGKATLASHFASSILCRNFAGGKGKLPCGECASCKSVKNYIHSDITVIKKQADKKNISINQIREFIRTMNLGTFGGSYKVGIIKEGETLSIEAVNALLKTLEEPKPRVVILLLTSFLEELATTVRSRGQILKFRPVAKGDIYDFLVKDHKVSRDFALNLSSLAVGRPAYAVKLFQEKDFFKDQKNFINSFIEIWQGSISERFRVIENIISKKEDLRALTNNILQIWQSVLRDLMMLQLSLDDLIINKVSAQELGKLQVSGNKLFFLNQKIEQAKRYLNANVQPKLVLEDFVLQI